LFSCPGLDGSLVTSPLFFLSRKNRTMITAMTILKTANDKKVMSNTIGGVTDCFPLVVNRNLY